MNKHIKLVKKWLADNESVSQQELEDNRAAAVDVAVVAAVAVAVDVAAVAYWVRRYEELTK
tara:strand:- start:278 stop:460 length:183 start_codon:yes stop_codon:yes gene_type:complete